MQFKTSEQIRKEKEASGKSVSNDAIRAQKIADKASLKYSRMAEESAKREAARVKKPTLVILPGVIETPALVEARGKPTKGPELKAALKKAVDKANAEPQKNTKQQWDETTKQWVKPNH